MFAYVLFMVDQLVAQELFEVSVDRQETRDSINDVPRKMKAVKFVEHGHIERGRGRSFLAVAVYVEVVVVRTLVGETVNEGGIAVKREDHGLVRGENRIELPVG